MSKEPADGSVSDPYQTESYKGVEIWVRVRAEATHTQHIEPMKNREDLPGGEEVIWLGSYSYFTRTIIKRSNNRISQQLEEKFSTKEEAQEANCAGARLAVDREIQVEEIMARNSENHSRHRNEPGHPHNRVNPDNQHDKTRTGDDSYTRKE
jgi:hypothetical protein